MLLLRVIKQYQLKHKLYDYLIIHQNLFVMVLVIRKYGIFFISLKYDL